MDQTGFIDKIANKIADLGLIAPAIFLLEANKPLAFIGSQLLLVAEPTVDILWPDSVTRNMADLLADPDQVDRLIASLEGKAAQDSNAREVRS